MEDERKGSKVVKFKFILYCIKFELQILSYMLILFPSPLVLQKKKKKKRSLNILLPKSTPDTLESHGSSMLRDFDPIGQAYGPGMGLCQSFPR